tara:strand:+ start:999 stop:1292 length:294 start_codon:yes stop_codon:yes gene_type:complete
MPQGPGTYGSKVGRPAKKKKAKSVLSKLLPSGQMQKKSRKTQNPISRVNAILRKKLGAAYTKREAHAVLPQIMRDEFGPQVTKGEIERLRKMIGGGR